MQKIAMLVVACLAWTGWLIVHSQTSSSEDRAAALSQMTSQCCREEKEAAQLSDHDSVYAVGESHVQARECAHAEAKITVYNSEAKPYDQTASPALMEIHLDETFTGDIDGESAVRALQVQHDDRSASLVSIQRFRGKLGGRQGSFVLQGSETVEAGKVKARWFVVPGSGTDGLSGLRGEGGFQGEFGKGSNGTLDYWFE